MSSLSFLSCLKDSHGSVQSLHSWIYSTFRAVGYLRVTETVPLPIAYLSFQQPHQSYSWDSLCLAVQVSTIVRRVIPGFHSRVRKPITSSLMLRYLFWQSRNCIIFALAFDCSLPLPSNLLQCELTKMPKFSHQKENFSLLRLDRNC